MQQTVQAQTISVERIGGQLARELAEFLLDVFRHPHVKDALHQRFDGEEVRVYVFQISHGLLQGIRRFIHSAAGRGMHLTLSGARAMLLLQIVKDPAGESTE